MNRPNTCTTDYFPPNHAQLSRTVKGHDPHYRIGAKRSRFWAREISYGVLVLILLLAAFGSVFVIAEFAR